MTRTQAALVVVLCMLSGAAAQYAQYMYIRWACEDTP